ncbi:MAG: zf-HC2 domain-containing protein [Deltaproteobacteria bacterium]|nr:zf-HC2 domain-containing protein [Deltaproteobacteria bacterium]
MDKECIYISGRLNAYSDMELSEKEHREVESHLETCSKCRIILAELKKTGTVIKNALSFDEADIDFSGIWKKIESNTNFRPPLWQRIIKFTVKPVVWMPAAFAGAAAGLLIYFLPGFFTGSDKPTPALVSRVESVYSSTGQVMVIRTAKSGSPLIWILPETDKEAG